MQRFRKTTISFEEDHFFSDKKLSRKVLLNES